MEIAGYRLNEPEKIDTPALLVYEEKVKHNIGEVIRVCGSAERVVPHVKTHKSAEVLALQMEAGMTSYKCATLREAELLAEHGAAEIIIAYPILHPAKLKRLCNLMRLYPESEFRAIASTPGAPGGALRGGSGSRERDRSVRGPGHRHAQDGRAARDGGRGLLREHGVGRGTEGPRRPRLRRPHSLQARRGGADGAGRPEHRLCSRRLGSGRRNKASR